MKKYKLDRALREAFLVLQDAGLTRSQSALFLRLYLTKVQENYKRNKIWPSEEEAMNIFDHVKESELTAFNNHEKEG